MARDLKNYRKIGNKDNKNETKNAQRDEPPAAMSEADIESMMDKYGGRSEQELMGELFSLTDKQKQDGSFDAKAMQKTAESIMPMLTSEQQQKLNDILFMLNRK